MIEPKYWILLALRNASKNYGFDIYNWFHFQKPDEFEILDQEFNKLIEDLEEAKVIERASNEPINYFLTKKGKRELSELKKHLTFNEYYIISKFPDFELNERLKVIETFVTLSFCLILLINLSRFSFSSYINNTYVLLLINFILIILLVLVALYVGNNLANIIFFWIFGQRDNLLKINEWIWKNKNILYYIIIVFVILLLDFTNFSPWNQSVSVLILYRICKYIFE